LPSGAIFNVYDAQGKSVFQEEGTEVAPAIISLPTGDIIGRKEYLDINPEARAVLEERGIEGYNEYVAQAQQDYENEVKTFIETSGGDYEFYSKQPTEEGKKNYLEHLQSVNQEEAEAFIKASGGNYEMFTKLPDVAKQAYLQMLQGQNVQQIGLAIINYAKSDTVVYSTLETGEEKFNFLKDKGYIPADATFSGEVDELGDPLVYMPGTSPFEKIDQFLDAPMWKGITVRTVLENKLLSEYQSPSTGKSLNLMMEPGGIDWNIDNVNNAFRPIPYEKKVYFDVPKEIQDRWTERMRLHGLVMTGAVYGRLIDINATWKNLNDQEKSLVLANYNPTPSGIEQAIDFAHIPILYEIKNWPQLSTAEKVMGVITDITLVAPLIGPVTRPLSALASRAVMATSIGERAATVVDNISRDISIALKSGNPNLLSRSSVQLRVLGEELVNEGIEGGAQLVRIGATLEQKAPTLSSWGQGMMDDLARISGQDTDIALTINRASGAIKPVEGIGMKSEAAIAKAEVRIAEDISTKVSEVNNVVELLQSATSRADIAASRAALQKLDTVLNKLAPFKEEVRGFEELIGLQRIASDELNTSSILSKSTIARINSIQLQPGIRSPLTAMGYKL